MGLRKYKRVRNVLEGVNNTAVDIQKKIALLDKIMVDLSQIKSQTLSIQLSLHQQSISVDIENQLPNIPN